MVVSDYYYIIYRYVVYQGRPPILFRSHTGPYIGNLGLIYCFEDNMRYLLSIYAHDLLVRPAAVFARRTFGV